MASGKSTYARLLREQLRGVECHDADEMVAITSDERCEQLEVWVRRALVDSIAACLPDWPLTEHTLNWAAWHRQHARDPRWQPYVIDRNGPATHQYDRWRRWPSDDPRWRVFVLDTTDLTVEQTLPLLLAWVEQARCDERP